MVMVRVVVMVHGDVAIIHGVIHVIVVHVGDEERVMVMLVGVWVTGGVHGSSSEECLVVCVLLVRVVMVLVSRNCGIGSRIRWRLAARIIASTATVVELRKMVRDVLHDLRVDRWDIYPETMHVGYAMHDGYGDMLWRLVMGMTVELWVMLKVVVVLVLVMHHNVHIDIF
jgi:hypothetical protein